LALNFGWRVAFVIITLIGIAWTVFWFAIATDKPSESSRVSAEELAELEAGQKTQQPARACQESCVEGHTGRPCTAGEKV
jgi:predicted MFS family arabinose efflux permease